MRAYRQTYLVAAALTTLLVAYQFLTAGIGIFSSGEFGAHEGGSWALHATTLAMLLVAAIGRLGRPAVVSGAVLLALVVVQSGLPDGPDALAALHPLGALIIFGGALHATQMASRWRQEGAAA